MRCDLEPSRVALWRNKDLALRLSGLAACTLVDAGRMSWDDLRPHREHFVTESVRKVTDACRIRRVARVSIQRQRSLSFGGWCQRGAAYRIYRVSRVVSGHLANISNRSGFL